MSESFTKPENLSPVDVWEEFLQLDHFKKDAPTLIPSRLEVGTRKDILLVTGENAGGKSLACFLIKHLALNFAKEDKVDLEVMDIGMHRRTESGIQRGMMFGDEKTSSTGEVSTSVMKNGISNSRNRKRPHYLILDEPDIGVGEGYHNSIGTFLTEYATTLPERCLGFVVVTHSRKIAKHLIEAGASSLRLGGDLRDISDWIKDGDLEKSLDELLQLQEISRVRFRGVMKMLKG